MMRMIPGGQPVEMGFNLLLGWIKIPFFRWYAVYICLSDS